MADIVLNPKTSALLLQDLQNELIKGSRPVVPLSGAALIANCQKLLTKVRAVGMPVIHVRVARRPDLKDAPRPPLGTPPASGGAPSPTAGSEGAAIVAELAPRPEDVVVTKHTTSPFHTTDLGAPAPLWGVHAAAHRILHYRCGRRQPAGCQRPGLRLCRGAGLLRRRHGAGARHLHGYCLSPHGMGGQCG